MTDTRRYFRKVIKIRATDSPNVRLALAELANGQEPTHTQVTPGVLSWQEYCERRGLNPKTGEERPPPNGAWDEVRQCIGLSAEFWKGGEFLLFPPLWLNRAEQIAESLRGRKRTGRAVGIDTGEGVANTAWCAVDDFGILELESFPTNDTSIITGRTIAFGRKWGVPDTHWLFDRGGGGKVHADILRAQGYPGVQTVAFGEGIQLPVQRHMHQFTERREQREDRFTYVDRRTEMYHEASRLMDPAMAGFPFGDGKETWDGFGVPAELKELRRQLALIPKLVDNKGRYWLPSKTKKDPESKIRTLTEIIGHSPDEADAFVLAVRGMLHKSSRAAAGPV